MLVIALNYTKAAPLTGHGVFPAPLHDLEALYYVVLSDESLPIDRMPTALCGFDAGTNLALALAQLESVRTAEPRRQQTPNTHPSIPRQNPTPYP